MTKDFVASNQQDEAITTQNTIEKEEDNKDVIVSVPSAPPLLGPAHKENSCTQPSASSMACCTQSSRPPPLSLMNSSAAECGGGVIAITTSSSMVDGEATSISSLPSPSTCNLGPLTVTKKRSRMELQQQPHPPSDGGARLGDQEGGDAKRRGVEKSSQDYNDDTSDHWSSQALQQKSDVLNSTTDPQSQFCRQQEQKEVSQTLSTEQINSLIDKVNIPPCVKQTEIVPTIPKSEGKEWNIPSCAKQSSPIIKNDCSTMGTNTSHTSNSIMAKTHNKTNAEMNGNEVVERKNIINGATSIEYSNAVPIALTSSSSTASTPSISIQSSLLQSSRQTRQKPQSQRTPQAATTTNTMKAKSSSSGRWSRAEHEAFLEGLKIYGREWKKVAQKIPTRTSAQIRSHAQKYFAKLARDEQQQAHMWLNTDGTGNLGSNSVNNPSGLIFENEKFLSPSVLERANKILKDPKGAQQEVEDTLKRLRDRYNELQQKVQEKQDAKLAPTPAGRSMNWENPVNGMNGKETSVLGNKSLVYPDRKPSSKCIQSQKCHTPMDLVSRQQQQQKTLIEKSTTTTNNSFNTENNRQNSTTSTHPRLRNDLLASKELIALHVLGGELFRSASKEDFSSMTTTNQSRHVQHDNNQHDTNSSDEEKKRSREGK